MTPERQLKALETLARARDMELNDLRVAAAAAHERLARLDQVIAALQSAIKSEGVLIGGKAEMLTAYAEFSAGARRRITALDAAREGVIADVEAADAKVMDGFRALKQIESAADARREDIADVLARKERAEADDIALQRAARANR